MTEASTGNGSVEIVTERYGRAAAAAAMLTAGGWHVANDLPQLIVNWSAYRPGWLMAAVWLGYPAIGVLASTQLRRGLPARPTLIAVGLPLLLLGNGLGQYANRHAPIFGTGNWTFGVVGWFGVLLLWRRTLPELIGFFAANAAIVGAAMLVTGRENRVDLARFIMVGYGVSILQLTVFVGGRFLAANARRATLAEDARARLTTEQLARDEVHRARNRRYQDIRQASAEVLGGLAAGRLDPADPGTQRRGRAAAAQLRRLIAETDDAPDPLLHELRACADTAERRGVEVDLLPVGLVPALPVGIRRALTDGPIQVLAAARTRARITIVATPGEVTVAVVADAETGRMVVPGEPDVMLSYEREGGELWVQTRWNGR
jgi:hypothetical protein